MGNWRNMCYLKNRLFGLVYDVMSGCYGRLKSRSACCNIKTFALTLTESLRGPPILNGSNLRSNSWGVSNF